MKNRILKETQSEKIVDILGGLIIWMEILSENQ